MPEATFGVHIRHALNAGRSVAVVLPVDLGNIDVAPMLSRLTDAELVRADRFHFDKDKVLYVSAHWLLSVAVAAALGPGAHEWRLTESVRGSKPVLEISGSAALFANLSHTAGMAAVAISRRAEIGIDVEAIRPMPDWELLAESTMTPRERAAIRAEPVPEALFFRLWTRKEAVLKAYGLGLSAPLTKIDVLDPDPLGLPVQAETRPHVVDLDLGRPVAGSVCVLTQCDVVVVKL